MQQLNNQKKKFYAILPPRDIEKWQKRSFIEKLKVYSCMW